jgi:RNA polymerase sigma-70 factor (ECF subfamily)
LRGLGGSGDAILARRRGWPAPGWIGPLYDLGAVTEPTPNPPDEALVVRALDGDEQAFSALVRRYQRRLTAFLGQLVGDAELARELSQEALIRAWSALDRFDPSFRFSTWLFRIAHNLGVDQLRRRRLPTVSLHRQDADGEDLEVSVPDLNKDPLGHLQNRELARRMGLAIAELRDEYRELVLLRHFAGLSYQEIAELKEMPLGTVKNKLFRAHSVLRTVLEEYL